MKLDKFLADKGLLVGGDKYETADGLVTVGNGVSEITANKPCFQDRELTITHFEWRENTGEEPKYTGEIEIQDYKGDTRYGFVDGFLWDLMTLNPVKRWRPVLDQEKKFESLFKKGEEEVKELAKITEEKPFPQVGDKVIANVHDESLKQMIEVKAKVIGIHQDNVWLQSDFTGLYTAGKDNCEPIPEKTDTEKTVEDLIGFIGNFTTDDVINIVVSAIQNGKIHGVKWVGE